MQMLGTDGTDRTKTHARTLLARLGLLSDSTRLPIAEPWKPVIARQVVSEVLQRRDTLPNRHRNVEQFRQLVAAEEIIDAAYLALDLPALRRAVMEWHTLATADVPQGA